MTVLNHAQANTRRLESSFSRLQASHQCRVLGLILKGSVKLNKS